MFVHKYPDAPRSVFALKGYAATMKRGTPTLAQALWPLRVGRRWSPAFRRSGQLSLSIVLLTEQHCDAPIAPPQRFSFSLVCKV